MTTPTNNTTTGKISRIQKDERQLLSQLRDVYGNDYKKYFECIRRGSNIPLTIRRIYKSLDEHKSYRRISDYFHRQRLAKKPKRSKLNDHGKSSHRSSTRSSTHLPRPIAVIQLDQEIFDDDDPIPQQSTSATIANATETNDKMDDDDIQEIQTLSSITFTSPPKQRLPLVSNRPEPQQQQQQQSTETSHSQPNLLSIRQNLQKALRELDYAIVVKTDSPTEVNPTEQASLPVPKATGQYYTKLDDIVRSLSSVVDQQQENVRLIINESSVLLLEDSKPSEKQSLTTQESIKYVLERLNTLIDRGHTVYDRIDGILSKI